MSGTAPTIAIASVKVGPRFRRDVGDLDSLMASIQAVGLLHPVVVTKTGDLVAGARRLEACRRLGWSEIPTVSVNGVDQKAAERDENQVRLNLTPSEAVAVADYFRAGVEAEAKAAQGVAGKERGRGQIAGGKLPQAIAEGKVRDVLARRVGMSGKTLEKATAVVRAAEQEPKKFGRLAERMDATGKVDTAYKDLQKARKAEAKTTPKKLPPLPESCRLICGALATVGHEVAPDSLDWVITDPPYPKDYIAVYGELADFAARTLRPGGSLLAMVGQSYLPEIMAALGAGLRYHWTLAYLTPGGQSVQLWERKVNTFWKPVLWFVKGDYKGDWIGDVCRSDPNDNDKRFHEWGQSESGMADIIHRFTYPGQTICDPFVGGGTTGVVAVKTGRLFVGIDSDRNAIAKTKERIASCQR
jgi:site-specific DNA-methyltransferase (adenine-specific)